MAARLFAERGYHGTSIGDVAAALDIHKSSVYAHIDSKQDMLAEIALSSVAAFHENLDAVEERAGPGERLHEALRAQLKAVASQLDQGIVWLHEWRYLEGRARERFVSERRRYEERVRAMLEEGVANGLLRKDLDVHYATELFLSVGAWAYSWMQDSADLDEDAEAFWVLLEKGVSRQR